MKIPKFVYAVDDIFLNDVVIKQYEVGIVASETDTAFEVNFVVGNKTVIVDKNKVALFDYKETGDSFLRKICNVCHRLLDVNSFQRNQNGKDNRPIRRPSCNDCRKIIDGAPLKRSEAIKWNKTKPSLTVFECPICHKTTIAELTSKIVLDHDHSTGLARGWICDSCNTGIGRFKDSVELLQNAIKYLQSGTQSDRK